MNAPSHHERSRHPEHTSHPDRSGGSAVLRLHKTTLLVATLLSLSAAQCAQPGSSSDSARPDPGASQPTQGGESDQERVARLEREARALAKTDGCASADQCLAAGLGERPCGGPRDYVIYCARSTDTSALNRKLAELKQAEMDMNRKSGAMSTCEFREPPRTALVGGACRAQ
jgi:hypothetical protein